MEEDLIIKKIFINDYIINTTLLKNSVSKLLINTLSNKFLLQFYNPIFRILSLITKLLLSNVFKYGRLYKTK